MNYLIKHGFQLISDGADWKQRSTGVSIQIIETIIPTSNDNIQAEEKRLFFVQSATWRTKSHRVVMNERRECHPTAVEQKAERIKNIAERRF